MITFWYFWQKKGVFSLMKKDGKCLVGCEVENIKGYLTQQLKISAGHRYFSDIKMKGKPFLL